MYISIPSNFFNQLSEFLRCESPSAFLGTCLSHHSFIILLITSTSALLTGLYLISTMNGLRKWLKIHPECVNALSGLYLISTQIEERTWRVRKRCQCPLGLIPHFYENQRRANYLGLLRVSMPSRAYTSFLRTSTTVDIDEYTQCQCPLGLIPHFYCTPSKT